MYERKQATRPPEAAGVELMISRGAVDDRGSVLAQLPAPYLGDHHRDLDD